jgi:UDP-glucose 4-epimerase
MKRVLITGVAGFIGSHVAMRFCAQGYHVVGVDDLSTGKRQNIPQGIQFIQGNLAQTDVYSQIPQDCQSILHLAGQSSGEISFDDPVVDLEMNTVSTLRLIEFGIRSSCQRMVYASSMSVYGAVPDAPIAESQHPVPLSCYGVGKLASEGYLRIYQRKLPFVAMRMFNVYGPGQDLTNLRQGMVSIYLAQALTAGRIEVKGSTERFRDFIFVDDVVEAWYRAATMPQALNCTINIGTGRRTSVGQLLDAICALVPGSSHFTSGSTMGDQSGIYSDNRLMKQVLGMDQTVELSAGLPEFVAAAREQLLATPGKEQPAS